MPTQNRKYPADLTLASPNNPPAHINALAQAIDADVQNVANQAAAARLMTTHHTLGDGNLASLTKTFLSSQQIKIKTGVAVFYAAAQYGNAYGPEIVFSEPFPTGILGVFMTPITAGGGYVWTPPTIDLVDKRRFRPYWPNDENVHYARAMCWLAIGY